jgi:hypothetical protein
MLAVFCATASEPAFAQWVQVPLRTASARANGNYGGEGCQQITGISMDSSGQVILMATDVGGLYVSTNGGAQWQPCNVGYKPRGASYVLVDPNDNTHFFAIGSNGSGSYQPWHGVWMSTNQGAAWTNVLPETTGQEYGARHQLVIDPRTSGSNEVVYWSTDGNVGSSNEGLWKSTNGGSSWNLIYTSHWSGHLAIGPTNGYLYHGDGSGLYESTNGGSSFTTLLTGNFTGVATSAAAPNTVYAVTPQSLLVSTNNGANWTTITNNLPTGSTTTWSHIVASPLNANNLMISSDNQYGSTLFCSNNGGSSWAQSQVSLTNQFEALQINVDNTACWDPTNPNTVWSTGYTSAVKSTDGGVNFKWANNGYTGFTCDAIYNFNPFVKGLLLVTSQDFQSGLTTTGGDTWTYQDPSINNNSSNNTPGWGGWQYGGYAFDSLNLVAGNAPAWGATRTVYDTYNGGAGYAAWTNTGNTDPNYEYISVACPDPLNQNIGFFDNWRTTNRGASWTSMNGCNAVFTYNANPNGNHALFGTNGNQVVTSIDEGVTWTLVHQFYDSYIRDVAYDWINNRLYVSDDQRQLHVWDGSTETDITGNLPGDNNGSYGRVASVCVDPVNPNIVYIGNHADLYTSNLAVAVSTNAGANWTDLTKQPGGGSGLDGGREAMCVRVDPFTRDLWAFGECYGVWRYPFASTIGSPYNGTHNLPGTVQAEDYDNGGNGTGYYLNSGTGGQSGYRNDNNGNIHSGAGPNGNGWAVGWSNAGEWYKYTVNVQTTGMYTIGFQCAAGGNAGTFHLEDQNGNNLTGEINAPATGSWSAWQTVYGFASLHAGTQTLTLVEDTNGSGVPWVADFDYISFSLPYKGPNNVPGIVQSEDYDSGAAGTAYSLNNGTGGQTTYRTDNNGCVHSSAGPGGNNYALGWSNGGEWYRYSINAVAAGTYTVLFQCASPGSGGTFHLQDSQGNNLTGEITAPNTGSWGTWQTVSAQVNLIAGPQEIFLVEDSNGSNGWIADFDYMSFSLPFNGPHTVPGTIQSEDYDLGGTDIGYILNGGTGNQSGYRPDNNGNVHTGAGSGGNGWAVGWSNAGELYNYTVNVQTTGLYTITFQVASGGPGGTFHLQDETGTNLTGSITAPNTGGWGNWQTVSASATLSAGYHVYSVVEDTNSSSGWICDFDDITFVDPPYAPTFSPAGGTYPGTQSITLSDRTSGATVYYTTNGTTPTTSSSQYSGAINVASSTTIKAIAFVSGEPTSAVATAIYTITAPAAPTGLKATAGASGTKKITITWTASAGATGYTVYRSSTSGGTYTSVGTSTTTSYVNTGLTAGSTYYYKVTATNSVGASAQAGPVSAKAQ